MCKLAACANSFFFFYATLRALPTALLETRRPRSLLLACAAAGPSRGNQAHPVSLPWTPKAIMQAGSKNARVFLVPTLYRAADLHCVYQFHASPKLGRSWASDNSHAKAVCRQSHRHACFHTLPRPPRAAAKEALGGSQVPRRSTSSKHACNCSVANAHRQRRLVFRLVIFEAFFT